MTETDLHCPDCKTVVTKGGSAWSGKKRYQQYRCPICRRSTLRPLDGKGNRVDAKLFESKHVEGK